MSFNVSTNNSQAGFGRTSTSGGRLAPQQQTGQPQRVSKSQTINAPERVPTTTAGSLEALQAWHDRSQPVDDNRVRWPENALANLALFIDWPATMDEQTKVQWQRVINRACADWQGAGLGRINLGISSLARQSDITLQWQTQTVEGRDYEVGHAKRRVSTGGQITHVTITLIETPLIDATLSTADIERRQLATLLHELGHALGLEHSQHSHDVMFHQGWRNVVLSPGDLAALKQLYPTIQSAAGA
ncbi:MAG: matrixin family metalloprotease [Cyanobacteria bacterium HKST-UBA06]|nr:matrixin family metalloprotease [Cyanobacteria bacterium HKST-UBA06]MCA9842103.1 matrixin family metalloprotease [Cyanobacteria bacterium HKST-UBA03]